MSAASPTPPDLPPELFDGVLAAAIGAVSFLVRVLCSTETHSLGYIFRRTLTAGLTALLVGAATQGYFSSDGMAFAAAGCAGYASPELLDALLARIRRAGANKGK